MSLFYVAELSLIELLSRCPDLRDQIPRAIDPDDENYIVRIVSDGSIEIGYPEDHWRYPLS